MESYGSMLLPQLLERASVQSAYAQIVSAAGDTAHRLTFHQLHHRAGRLARALIAIGVKPGDPVATIGWNDHRHIELYFAVTGLGAALHTIDPHLDTAAIHAAILAAGDRFVFFDARDDAQYERLVALRPHILGMISMTAVNMCESHRDVLDYERLLAEHERECHWALTEPNTVASLAASPGEPQRLLSTTHRMMSLHAAVACADEALALDARDSMLLAVPLHLHGAWSLVCAAVVSGANLILPGAGLGTSQLVDLMRDERVTFALAPSHVWAALLDFLDAARMKPAQVLPLRRAITFGGPLHPATQARLVHAFGADAVAVWPGPLPPDEGGPCSTASADDPSRTASATGDPDELPVDQS